MVDEGVYYLQLGTTVSTRSDRTSHPHFAHTFSRPTVSMTPMRVEVWKVGSMKNKRVGIVMVDPALGRQGEWTGQLDIVKVRARARACVCVCVCVSGAWNNVA